MLVKLGLVILGAPTILLVDDNLGGIKRFPANKNDGFSKYHWKYHPKKQDKIKCRNPPSDSSSESLANAPGLKDLHSHA